MCYQTGFESTSRRCQANVYEWMGCGSSLRRQYKLTWLGLWNNASLIVGHEKSWKTHGLRTLGSPPWNPLAFQTSFSHPLVDRCLIRWRHWCSQRPLRSQEQWRIFSSNSFLGRFVSSLSSPSSSSSSSSFSSSAGATRFSPFSLKISSGMRWLSPFFSLRRYRCAERARRHCGREDTW